MGMLIIKDHNVIKRKIIVGFKHIRFKSIVKDSSTGANVNDALNHRTNKLAEILDCTKGTAKLVILKNKSILAIQHEDFVRNATFCKKHFSWGDIIDFPLLISLNSGLLHHRYFSLLELGCTNISAPEIFRFPQLIKMTPKELHKQDISLCYSQSLKHFDTYLQDYEIMKNCEVKSHLQKMYENNDNLWKIKEAMNAEFLASKLDCSLFKAHEMFKRYPPLRVQSILITTKLLDVLFKEYEFTVAKIFKVPILLSLHHEIAMHFLQKVPYILGVKTTKIVNKLPLLLRRPVDDVHQAEKILKKFNISDQQLLCCPRVLSFRSCTLQNRLEYLCSSEDFALQKSYKKFLWLVYHYNILKPRLQALKEADKPCSISMFISSKAIFERYLSIGTKCRTHVKDTSHYLSKVFNCSEQEILLRLKKFKGSQNSSVRNCSSVIKYLFDAGINKKQVFQGLEIVFYDIDIVKEYFEEMQTHSSYQPFSEWATHFNLVQLLIYSIEVKNAFDGSRVCGSRNRWDDSDFISSYAG